MDSKFQNNLLAWVLIWKEQLKIGGIGGFQCFVLVVGTSIQLIICLLLRAMILYLLKGIN